MKDIASHVGVSVSSVSLVLSNQADGRVNPKIAERIRGVAAEMGYVPNHLARSLKTNRSHTLGLVSDRVATVPFSGHMLAGAQEAAWEEEYLLLLIDTAGHDELQGPAVQSLLQRNIDALIFATTFHRMVNVPLVPSSVPIVILDGRPSTPEISADFVVPDEEGGARTAVEHLLAAGHRRIGFCTVTAYPIAAALRRRGYESALIAAGIVPDPALVVEASDASTRDAIVPARKLLSREDRPTAVFCFGDQIAMGFYQVASTLDLNVPRDLSVVGFDNQEFVADSIDPGLTSIQLPHREMGSWAIRRALQRVGEKGKGSQPIETDGFLMPCPIVERDSVAAPGLDHGT